MRPAYALGHVPGKLLVVLYGMLRDVTRITKPNTDSSLG
jgi:hypothetical protein